MRRQLRELEKKTGYEFQDKKLLSQAMTHSSYANEHGMNKSGCNERLEFLVIFFITSITSSQKVT